MALCILHSRPLCSLRAQIALSQAHAHCVLCALRTRVVDTVGLCTVSDLAVGTTTRTHVNQHTQSHYRSCTVN